MDATKEFLPLKSYRKGILVAVVIPILLVLILAYHLYQIKLEQQYNIRFGQYEYVSQQLKQEFYAAHTVLDSIAVNLARPISFQRPPHWLDDIEQHPQHFYHQLPSNGGEIVGQGQVSEALFATKQWQTVLSLNTAFDAALALQGGLYAIAYVNDQGFTFVKRRDTTSSHFISQLIQGRFKPDFSRGDIVVGSPVELFDQQLFALGKKISSLDDSHILMIYSSNIIDLWLQNIGSLDGVMELRNQSGELIAGQDYQHNNDNTLSSAVPWQHGLHFFAKPAKEPISLNYHESYAQFAAPIQREVLLELGLLLFFILFTFTMIVWLSGQIFVRPLKHFVNYLSLQEHAPKKTLEYPIPQDWQPWFVQVKQVVEQKSRLMQALKKHNQELDDEVKRKQQALKQSYEAKERQAALLNAVLDTVPDIIYFKNIDGSFIGCNLAFEQFMGVKKAELVARTQPEVTSGLSVFLQQEALMAERQEQVATNFELGARAFYLTTTPLKSENNKLLGCLGVARDVTAAQDAYNALRDSEENFRAATEFAPNGVILAAIDGKILEMNKAAKRFLSLTKDCGERRLDRLFDEQNWHALQAILTDLLGEKKKVANYTVAQSGEYNWLQLSISLVWDNDQQPKYYVMHIQNITSLLLAKQEAERATLAKSRFIANISHEIRTPINAILGLADMIQSDSLSKLQQQKLTQLSGAATELLTMLNSILEFAKVESHQGTIVHETFQTSQALNAIESLIKPLCLQKGLTFAMTVDPEVWPYLYSDEDKIKQILVNLLSNAVKYTGKGTVGLTITQVNDETAKQTLKFAVWDTGVGIKAEQIEHLFDAFTQGDESFTRKHEGIGLGLAIVKQEVALLGGEIQVDSTPEQGSCFYFELQLDKGACPLVEPKKDVFCLLSDEPLPSYFTGIAATVSLSEWQQRPRKLEKPILVVPPSLTEQVANANLASSAIVLHGDNELLEQSNNIVLNQAVFYQAAYTWLAEYGHMTQAAEQGCAQVAGILCLIVDDNRLNLDISENMLAHNGITTVGLSSAEQLNSVCETLQPDIVLMDIHMPDIDGYQATQLLRQRWTAQQLPIIALTANVSKEEKNKAMEVGMNDYLVKPINGEQTCKALAAELSEEVINLEPFFDYEFALSQMMQNERFLQTMLDKFAKLCREYLDKLAAVEQGEALFELAHGIKGAAAGLGFKRLAKAAKDLESRSKTLTIITSRTELAELEKALSQVMCFIELKKVAVEDAAS
ncbi:MULTISPECIES: PAS domain-containing sensor histidine kinase [unclassified Pseudoalteromonas]|uniref:PAS domain-containing sensor histidine kinase n=1 Tax=unclassified Pseudoalteromonas TaxID=194690 RepID=UPI003014FC72